MPYISQTRRDTIDPDIQRMFEVDSAFQKLNRTTERLTAGDLNYTVYRLALEFIKVKGKSYNNISDAIKALTGAAHEVERRILDNYENEVIKRNGDIE